MMENFPPFFLVDMNLGLQCEGIEHPLEKKCKFTIRIGKTYLGSIYYELKTQRNRFYVILYKKIYFFCMD